MLKEALGESELIPGKSNEETDGRADYRGMGKWSELEVSPICSCFEHLFPRWWHCFGRF